MYGRRRFDLGVLVALSSFFLSGGMELTKVSKASMFSSG